MPADLALAAPPSLPGALRAALGADALDRLQPADRFDQDAVLLRRLAQAGADRPVQWQLQQQPDRQHQRHRDGRHQRQPAADQPDHADEQQQERQIDQGRDRGRREEVAQALELAQIVGERAGRNRPGRHLQAHHLGEHGAGELDVGDPAGGVDEIAAQHLEQEIEAEHDQHAAGEHPQGLDRVVRHDAVVDVHDEQRARQREQVDQHRGQRRPRRRPATDAG